MVKDTIAHIRLFVCGSIGAGIILGNHVRIVVNVVERCAGFFDDGRRVLAVGYFEARAGRYPFRAITYRRRARLNGKPCLRGVARPVSSVGAAVDMRSGTAVAGLGGNGAVAGLHVGAPVALVGADTVEAWIAGRRGITAGSVCQGGGAFELAEDGFLVGEEVANETVGVTLVHSEGGVGTGSEDTRGEGLGERRDILFCCGREFDEAGKVCSYCVEGGDVGKAKLAQGVLEDRNAGLE